MQERRRGPRDRTYLGGQVAYGPHCSTIDCVVRNMSQNGAKMVFPFPVLIPSEFEMSIQQRGESRRARMIWRTDMEAGVGFLHCQTGAVFSIESARRIKMLEAERDALAKRLTELSRPA